MKIVAAATLAFFAAACSNQPNADADELAEFNPPSVQLRGDTLARQERRFKRLDANGDGSLAATEFPKRRPARTAALDRDRNGVITRSEFVEGGLARFDAMDADRDGQVTPGERSAAAER